MSAVNLSRPSVRTLRVSRWSLLIAAALVLAACNKDQPAPATGPAAPTPAATATTPGESAKVNAMSTEQLLAAASLAYNDNRLYAPAENNALEYYLALRDKLPGDAAVSSALVDLLPMTVIATEQSVAREDFSEAQRLANLIGKADPQHPALVRLKNSITSQQQLVAQRAVQQQLSAEEEARKRVELERKRAEEQRAQQQLAARELATRQEAERRAATERTAAQRAADQRAAEQRAAEQRAAERSASQPATQPATQPSRPSQPATQPTAQPARSAAAGELRALSTPQPRFPPEALRSGQSGEVQVEFTVGVDGSVTAARVVRSNPARVFDREAVNAVRKWRFQPVDSPVTTRRTIGFQPGG